MKAISSVKNKEEILSTDIEVLKPIKLSSRIYIDNVHKESDEINRRDMSDDKYSNVRDQIGENKE